MAKKIRNVSPYGDLDVPLLGQVVERDATVDVSDEAADILLLQAENWLLAEEESREQAPPRATRRAAKSPADKDVTK